MSDHIESAFAASHLLDKEDLEILKEAKDHMAIIHREYSEVMSRLYYLGYSAYNRRCEQWEK